MKIGQKRIAVVIGNKGETKKEIEDRLGVRIELDSKTGNCEIFPNIEHPKYVPLNVYTAQKIVHAISRGFNPVKAMKLTEDSFELEIMDLISILGKSEKHNKRVKSRIIGRNGEMRKTIERYSKSYVSVYGKTVSIIAEYNDLQIARKAIKMIINGLPLHSVQKFLEKKYQEAKREEFKKLYKPEF